MEAQTHHGETGRGLNCAHEAEITVLSMSQKPRRDEQNRT